MRQIAAFLLFLPSLGSAQHLDSLVGAYGIEALESVPSIIGTKLTLTGPGHPEAGAEAYFEGVDVHISNAGIGVSVLLEEEKVVLIPTSEVTACAMTCFGTDDRRLDLVVVKSGTVLSFPANPKLENWCWDNAKQVFPGDAQRAWEYEGHAFPPANSNDQQFTSRGAYDKALFQSCLGY